MKKITVLLAGVAASWSLSVFADSQVTVYYPGTTETAQVSHAQNLAQLLASPALNNRSWWPGTVIAEKQATAVAEQQYQQTLTRLKAWAAEEEGDQAAAINQVIRQLTALNVTGRQFTSLDPDWVRLRPQANRRLEGEYRVYTVQQPSTVTVMGAIAGAGKTSWQPGRDTRDYLDGHQRLAGAERNIAVVIAPDGDVKEAPVAYWNHRHTEAAPGSILYIGFSAWALPEQYEDLNQQIISVLTHRIPD